MMQGASVFIVSYCPAVRPVVERVAMLAKSSFAPTSENW